MKVGPLTGGPAEWDAFVRRQTGWTHFHLRGWKEVLEEIFGLDCPYLEAREEAGGLRGVLPLVRVKSRLFGHYLVSMPFLNYGGPLGEPEAVRRLAAEAARLAGEEGADLLELRSRVPLEVDLPVSHRKITVTLPLPDDPHDLWDALDSKVRSQVRRPRKAGAEMRFGADQVGDFYEVFAHHMRDLGTPVLPRELFQRIADRFGDEAWFGVVRLQGRPVAAGCGFRWDGELEMTWASALWEFSRQAPNMLLYWSFMERAIEEGLETFNFGRCTPDSGTHRFKRQWGSRDEPLFWYQRAADGTRSTPSPDDEKWAWGPKLWSKLPVPVATALGPRIVRYIP